MKHKSAMRMGWLCLALLAAPVAYAWGKAPEAQNAPSSAVITATDVSSAAAVAAEVPSGQAAEAASAAEAANVSSGAAAKKKPAPTLTGFLEMGGAGAFVTGDKGRFREDNWMPDGASGGISKFLVRSTGPDENGLEFQADGRLMCNYDYRLNFLLKKKDAFYVTFNASDTRKWFDGSAEYWNPGTYGFPAQFSRWQNDLHLENRNMNLEVGLTPRDGPQVVFGWHRFEQVGEDSLLRGGGTSLTGNPVPPFTAVPTVDICDRESDTYYFEISKTFDSKYNFRLRQEWEQFRDTENNQEYDYTNGVLSASSPLYQDNDRYHTYTSIASFDAFLNDDLYVASGYMYTHTANNPQDSYLEPYAAPGSQIQFNTMNSSVEENTNVWSNGVHQFNFLGVKDLDATAGVRVGLSQTTGDTVGLTGAAQTPALFLSSVNEREATETTRVAYRGWQQTTLIFDTKLDQRQYPISDYESSGTGGPFDYAEDGWQNQSYKMTAIERFNQAVKTTASWRFYNDRTTSDLGPNSNFTAYPNFLGPMLEQGNEARLSTDLTLNQTTAFNILYQYTGEHIQTQAGNINVANGVPFYSPTNVENLNENQIGGSIITSPVQNLSLVGTMMVDNMDLKTPGASGGPPASGNQHARNNDNYDFVANAVTLSLDAQYAFNTKTSAYGHFQRTATADYSSSSFDSVGIGLSRKISKNQTVTIGYQFNDYCNYGEFQNYKANMILATYRICF